jgi:crossover junction endodeoxyribonuclease RuvC
MHYVGIDPGLSGAIAVIELGGAVTIFDVPTHQVKVGKKMKNIIDAYHLATILQGISANQDIAVAIEKVTPMPSVPGVLDEERRTMGATSAFNFGMGYGIYVGVLSALRIHFQEVHPATWKRAMMDGAGKEKKAARIRAARLFPVAASKLTREKDDGRAEALLIAEWGRRNYFDRPVNRFMNQGSQQPEIPF